MFGSNWKWLTVGILLLGVVTLRPGEANAWGHWGCVRPACWWAAPYYSTGCYPACATVSWFDPCCSSVGSWYLGVRPGPVRRALLGPCRWYYGGWYSTFGCCSICAEETRCCDTLSSDSPSNTPENTIPSPTPAPEKADESGTAEPPPTPATSTPNRSSKSAASLPTSPSGQGWLTIRVPEDADVIINGLKTTSRGLRRTYLSYGLQPGSVYNYQVRVQVHRGGKLLEEVRQVRLTAGAREALAVDFHPGGPTARIARAW